MITGITPITADPTSWQNTVNDTVRLLCDVSAGAAIVSLPSIESLGAATNVEFLVVDAENNAAVNNITVRTANTLTPVTTTITATDGATVLTITTGVMIFNQDTVALNVAVITGWPGENGSYPISLISRVGGTYELTLTGGAFAGAIPAEARITVNTLVYAGDKFNNADSFVISTSGQSALVKVVSEGKFAAFKSA